MGIFGKLLGDKVKNALAQYSGDKDFLEAMCSACALVAGAEGGIDDKEYDATLQVISANSNIVASFAVTEIESVFGRMAPKTATRSGRNELKTEIRESIARDPKKGLPIMLAALDVADQGGIEKKEEEVLRDLCQICGVNYDKLIAG